MSISQNEKGRKRSILRLLFCDVYCIYKNAKDDINIIIIFVQSGPIWATIFFSFVIWDAVSLMASPCDVYGKWKPAFDWPILKNGDP